MNIRLGRRIRRKNAGIDFMSVDLPLKVNNTGESGRRWLTGRYGSFVIQCPFSLSTFRSHPAHSPCLPGTVKYILISPDFWGRIMWTSRDSRQLHDLSGRACHHPYIIPVLLQRCTVCMKDRRMAVFDHSHVHIGNHAYLTGFSVADSASRI